MAAYFFDSSEIVKRYVAESGTAWVSSLTDVEAGNKIYVCRLTFVEVISAIIRRARASELSPTEAIKAIADLRYDFSQEYSSIEMSPTLVESAGELAEQHALRAYDAVQLAAAAEINSEVNSVSSAITLISADTALNAAAIAEGLAVDDPNTHP